MQFGNAENNNSAAIAMGTLKPRIPKVGRGRKSKMSLGNEPQS